MWPLAHLFLSKLDFGGHPHLCDARRAQRTSPPPCAAGRFGLGRQHSRRARAVVQLRPGRVLRPGAACSITLGGAALRTRASNPLARYEPIFTSCAPVALLPISLACSFLRFSVYAILCVKVEDLKATLLSCRAVAESVVTPTQAPAAPGATAAGSYGGAYGGSLDEQVFRTPIYPIFSFAIV